MQPLLRSSLLCCPLVVVLACSATNEKTTTSSPDAGTEVSVVEDTGVGFVADDATPMPSDPEADEDRDGYRAKDDCNDRDPTVNPGAYDVPGDMVDNDCDGSVDNASSGCDDSSLKLDSKDANDFARALGICQTTTVSATGKDKRWGLLSAQLIRADGSAGADPWQHGIMKKFGTNVSPRSGTNLVVLSSGTARTPGQPNYMNPFSPSYETASAVTPPTGWPRPTGGCPAPTKTTANDSVGLELQLRVPTNAKSFSFDFDFYSSEYIKYVCTTYNDSFVALLQTISKLNPANNGNISFDALMNPINVNSGFFEVCTPGTQNGHSFMCAKGRKELEGTGYADPLRPSEGGATSWLRTRAPVVPGEMITLRFMIWDTQDHYLDSAVLIDNFVWEASATVPTTDRPPS